MKPRLPREIELTLPTDIVWLISTYLENVKKVDPPYKHDTLQRELTKIQRSPLRGKNEMYMKDLDDFILD